MSNVARLNPNTVGAEAPEYSATEQDGMTALGPGCVKTQSDLVVMPRGSTNFRIFLLSTRPYASKFMVRFYRAEFSHSLGQTRPLRPPPGERMRGRCSSVSGPNQGGCYGRRRRPQIRNRRCYRISVKNVIATVALKLRCIGYPGQFYRAGAVSRRPARAASPAGHGRSAMSAQGFYTAWVKGCRCYSVGSTSGVRQIAADLSRRPTRQPWATALNRCAIAAACLGGR
jgi:hypothetical protein